MTATTFSCNPEQAADNLEIVRTLLAEVQAKGVSAEELEQAKNKIASRVVRYGEKPMGRMRTIASSWMYCQEFTDVDTELARFDAVTPESVREYLNRYPIDQATVVGYGPLKAL